MSLAALVLLCLLSMPALVAAGNSSGCETVLLQAPSDTGGLTVVVKIHGGEDVYATWDIAITNSTAGTILIRDTLSTVVGPSGRSWQLAQVIAPWMSTTLAPLSFVSCSEELAGSLASGDALRLTLVWDTQDGRRTGEWVWEYRCPSVVPAAQPTHVGLSPFWRWFIVGWLALGLVGLLLGL